MLVILMYKDILSFILYILNLACFYKRRFWYSNTTANTITVHVLVFWQTIVVSFLKCCHRIWHIATEAPVVEQSTDQTASKF